MQPIVSNVMIRNVHHGIHLVSRNRNVIISNSHIRYNSGVGIYMDSQVREAPTFYSWEITGNLITSQMVNIHLENTHGVSISGNTFLVVLRGISTRGNCNFQL
jgi:hypothetical protein